VRRWDHATGRSRGYGFVSFATAPEAEAAIAAMHGQPVGARCVRCGWAAHKAEGPAAPPPSPQLLDRADPTNTNVYVGNLAPHLTGAFVVSILVCSLVALVLCTVPPPAATDSGLAR
jgi:RNA recognition motif-containing protein